MIDQLTFDWSSIFFCRMQSLFIKILQINAMGQGDTRVCRENVLQPMENQISHKSDISPYRTGPNVSSALARNRGKKICGSVSTITAARHIIINNNNIFLIITIIYYYYYCYYCARFVSRQQQQNNNRVTIYDTSRPTSPAALYGASQYSGPVRKSVRSPPCVPIRVLCSRKRAAHEKHNTYELS